MTHAVVDGCFSHGSRAPRGGRAGGLRRCRRDGWLALAIGFSWGCGDDEPENVLPTATVTATDTLGSTSAGSEAESSGGGEVTFPRAFLFDCIDVRQLGEPGELPLQAGVLENAWGSDIENYKLNIIFEVVSRTEGGGQSQVGIRSGIGSGLGDQCFEPISQTDAFGIDWDPAQALWTPGADDTCADAVDPGASAGGSYVLDLGADDLVYVYAEDDDGTTFNCTPDAATPDAVPLRALHAEVTATADQGRVAGELTACLVESEAEGLCSCLVECVGDGLQTEGDCAGCPAGGTTLDKLLGGVPPSARCSELVGAPAFDLRLAFRGRALPELPAVCP